MPVPPINTHAKKTLHFPVPPVKKKKKACGTIAFPISISPLKTLWFSYCSIVLEDKLRWIPLKVRAIRANLKLITKNPLIARQLLQYYLKQLTLVYFLE